MWQANNVYNAFVRFLAMLEEEVYSTASPIWDAEFMNTTSLPLTPTQGMVQHTVLSLLADHSVPQSSFNSH